MNCTMRKPCTEQDYYDIRTACDNEHKVWGHFFEKNYIEQLSLILSRFLEKENNHAKYLQNFENSAL